MPHLSWNEVRARAIRFSRDWSEATSERADKQTFYNEFFNVFGIRRASVASFEANVRNLQGNVGAIDLLWRGKLIVEHKSRGHSLAQAETEAFGYIEDLTREGRFDEVPRFVLVSDFANVVLYDLEPEEQRNLPLFAGRPMSRLEFPLSDFPRHIRAFAFILGQTHVRLDPEDPANERAYDRMCELHDALKAGGFGGHELERLLVRILFCVFAEDTGIFEPESFTNFIRQQTREDGSDLGAQLNLLFDWLNNPQAENRLEDTDPLYGFRYVNGGLFAERLGFPRCTRAMREALIECCEFHWAKISPAVFGSLFQGVIDDRVRRQQGAHYTCERDIMKIIRSLFLDELRTEWERLMAWVRAVCGRLESRYRYSAGLAYNNFPWPNTTPEQRERVVEKAQAVLDARAPHLPPRGMSTLADIYDPNTMPPELHRAHTELDRAVERCYRAEPFRSDRERVEHLFRLYEQLTAPLLPATPRTRGRRQQIAAATRRPRRGRTPGLPSQTD